jgi:hypothetical protein
MVVDTETVAKIVGALAPILGLIVKHYLEGRARVVSFIGHISKFTLQNNEKTAIHAHSVIVRNTGRKPAHNVRLMHSNLPFDIEIHPPIKHSIERNPDGSGEIILPILVPREQVTISYLYFPPLIWSEINTDVKSNEGFAKLINVIHVPRYSPWILGTLWFFVFFGLYAFTSGLVRLVAPFL